MTEPEAQATRASATAAVHLVLVSDGRLLMVRRANTGYEDGSYSLAAGHIEPGESGTEAMVRETKEEIGVELRVEDLSLVHVMHRCTAEPQPRVDFFFTCRGWTGDPQNTEPHKCDDVRWFGRDDLPENTVPYVAAAVASIVAGEPYSEFGWPH